MATMVRVEGTVHARLLELSRIENRPMGEVIADAVRQYEREKFWDGVREDIERLKADPIAWQEYQHEFALFDGTLMDGLEHEPPYYTPNEEEEIRARSRTESR